MKIAVNVGLSALILALGILGLKILGKKPEIPTEAAASTDDAVLVVTKPIEPFEGPFHMKLDGEAVTYRIVAVGAEVEGRLITKTDAARGGTFIQQGDLLFEIDPTNYQLTIDSLNAQLLQADEELNALSVDLQNTAELTLLAEEDWELQKKQLDRVKTLLNRRTANEVEVEAAQKQELIARNALQSLRNQQRSIQQQQKTRAANKQLVAAQLRRAETDLARCRVVSPLDGRIVDDSSEEGDYIKSGDTLVHISDGSRMEIKCQLQAEELAWIWQQPRNPPDAPTPQNTNRLDPIKLPKVMCEVAFEFEGVETIWDGHFARIEGTGIDRDTRTFPCRILVEEPRKTRNNPSEGLQTVAPPTLLSGMYVSIRVPIESPLPLLKLPIEAVRPGGQVWVSRNGVLKILEISLAHTERKYALVRRHDSGIQDDDRVIVSPLTSVQDGMRLNEQPQETAE